jgi:hypothetical protein
MQEHASSADSKKIKYFNNYFNSMKDGINYYRQLVQDKVLKNENGILESLTGAEEELNVIMDGLLVEA